MLLKNKIAVITGAGQGIGKAIALAFAAENCRMLVSDLNKNACEDVVAEIKEQGGSAIAFKCDVSDKIEIDKMVNETIEEFGGLDIIVNNAGIFPFKAFTDITEEEWDKVMNVNLKSAFLCSQAAAKMMSAGGRIINISSIASVIGFSGLVHYCSSKSGMSGLTRAVALEIANRHITVNAIAPGSIETPGATAGLDEAMKEQTIAAIPLGRMGTGEDIAQAAVFLASEKASYITGQTIIVDGGWTLR
ncbi:MAG: SDR family NAD(P)-dependent oxidoreductase [bacterium]|nr:SDR family NAD(P)-dependent oxidoreductase [bacterium]